MEIKQNFCIYLHKNKYNGKVYVGQTCQKPEKRWNYGYGYQNSPRFYSAICCYGWDAFEHIILETNLSAKEANEKEQYYILQYNSLDPNYGYNMTEGGYSLANYWEDENHRKEQSEKRKKYFAEHPDKKEENYIHLVNIRNKTAKIRAEKMKDNYQNGEGLFKINQSRKKSIKCIETNEIFSSLCEASKKYNIPAGNISKVIHGERKIAGGFHWVLIENESMN